MSEAKHTALEVLEQLLELSSERATGTLVIAEARGLTKQVFLREGAVGDLDAGREDGVLEAALLDTRVLTDKDIARARKVAARAEKTLGEQLLEVCPLPEDRIVVAIESRLQEEILEVFAWKIGHFEFFNHGADERLESFCSDLTGLFEISVDTQDLSIEAARRLCAWETIEARFPMLRDVYYATPASFCYFQERETFPDEYALISKTDGTCTLQEAIRDCGLNCYHALRLARGLESLGKIEAINPVQLFQLGVDFAAKGLPAQAARSFERAYERGLNDFDVLLKLAQSLETAGNRAGAVKWYAEFSAKCELRGQRDDAIQSLQSAVACAPLRTDIQARLIGLLLSSNQPDKALEQAREAARLAASTASGLSAEDQSRLLDPLLAVEAQRPRSTELLICLADLAEACGARELAVTKRKKVAEISSELKDHAAALEAYQRIFCDGNQSLEIRLKLIDLHESQGHTQLVVDHLHAILNGPDSLRPKDLELLTTLHEKLYRSHPGDRKAARWLARRYVEASQVSKARELLLGWISHLEKEQDHEEAIRACETLVSIDDSFESMWSMARIFAKARRAEEAMQHLRKILERALAARDLEQAQAALKELEARSPLDIETRRLRAQYYKAAGREDLVRAKQEEVEELEILSGQRERGEEAARRTPASPSRMARLASMLSRLYLEQGEEEKSIAQAVRAASCHLGALNVGNARDQLEEVLRRRPAHAEAARLLAEANTLETRFHAPFVPPPAPQAAPIGAPAFAPAIGPAFAQAAAPEVAPVVAPAFSSTIASPTGPARAATPLVAPAPASAAPAPGSSRTAVSTPASPWAPPAAAAPALEAPHAPPAAPTTTPPLQAHEREPFQGARPVVTRISGITAKLKRLKGGDSVGPEAPGDSERGDASAATAHPPPAGGAAPPASEGARKAVTSAAARLKALAAGKAAPAAARGAAGPVPADAAAPAHWDASTPLADAPRSDPAASSPGVDIDGPPAGIDGTATRAVKLTKSASKLAELRKKAAQT